ncbi:MAG TPA: hypothetical protein VGR57_14895 [Ktedonobacterales bacterium]|nr:hypothetical protein [Ktedonobacterales bacterium]
MGIVGFLRWMVGGCIITLIVCCGSLGLVILQRRQVSRWWLRLGFAILLGLVMGMIGLTVGPFTALNFAVLAAFGVVGGFFFALYFIAEILNG